jgi:hypothetical protein
VLAWCSRIGKQDEEANSVRFADIHRHGGLPRVANGPEANLEPHLLERVHHRLTHVIRDDGLGNVLRKIVRGIYYLDSGEQLISMDVRFNYSQMSPLSPPLPNEIMDIIHHALLRTVGNVVHYKFDRWDDQPRMTVTWMALPGERSHRSPLGCRLHRERRYARHPLRAGHGAPSTRSGRHVARTHGRAQPG